MLFSLILLGCSEKGPDPKVLMAQTCGKSNPKACFKLGTTKMNASVPDYSAARKHFATGCSVHHHPSCNALGLLVRHARGGPKDMVRAAGLFETACEKGSMRGCVNFAMILRDGDGRDEDPETAVGLFEKACDAKVPQFEACTALAAMVREGTGIEKKDEERADTLLTKACEGKYPPACEALGDVFIEKRGKDNLPLAIGYYDKACELDANRGCFQLGDLHFNKKAPDASFEQAGEFYSMVCRVDTSRGCYEMAELMTEEKIPSREGEKEALYKLSCESGNSEACPKR